MHIPDGFLTMPVNIGAALLSIAYGYYAHKKIAHAIAEKDANIPLLGCTAAFVFAAQMINFPILSGTSGHFLGGAFAALVFGPHLAFFIMGIVLLIQAFFYADGGLVTLGSNMVVMAMVAPQTGYWSFCLLKRWLANKAMGYMVASWLSVVMAAAACSCLLGISGTFATLHVLVPMVAIHALIGIGEGIITASALAFLMKAKICAIEEFAHD